MRKTVLYIAMSLDGYIASKDGGVEWLGGDGSDNENEGSYSSFFDTIDTVVLGYKTYNQIRTELSPDVWMYADKTSYVITHKRIENRENILFCNNLSLLIKNLKKQNGKDIWICGGAEIVNELLELNLIDRFCITIIPTILGDGIRLFHQQKKELLLKLISTQSYNGMTDLIYELRK